ncbi:MAG: divergent polysaccharide deacetylase family protein [Candidatus Electryoneaceae bacterium]|nr:divergent polysaccharide deacetylase family protein [Candidatus Electryoneaceae bacterium]
MKHRTKPQRKNVLFVVSFVLGMLIISATLLDWIFLPDYAPKVVLYDDTISQHDTIVTRPAQLSLSTDSTGPSPEYPWIALIIDDFGPAGSVRLTDDFLSLPFPFTLAVMPGNLGTVKIGQMIAAAGGETFIHLPMEPMTQVAMNERDMLLVGSTAEEIRVILDRATAELPMAIGLNNHMGSKATLDVSLMNLLAQELDVAVLYFTTVGQEDRRKLIQR